MGIEIVIIVLLVVLNGVFSGTELALVSAKRGRLQLRADSGERGAVTALRLQDNPNRLLSTVQVGITLIGTLTGVFGGASIAERIAPLLQTFPVLAPYAETIALSLVVVLIAYLSLVIGELTPKRLALQNAEGIAVVMAQPMQLLSHISRPIIALLSWSTDALLLLLGRRASDGPNVTEEDIRQLVQEGTTEGAVEPHEQQLIERVFALGDRSVRQIMTPRQRVQAINVATPVPQALDYALDMGYSRLPVYEDVLDRIVGTLHVRELFALSRADAPTLTVRAALRPAVVVPETSRAADLLPLFRKSHQHLAVVIDETGGVAGIVTLEDALEELVGEIQDETDEAHIPHVVQREDGSWLVDGLTPISEIQQLLGLDKLPNHTQGRYDTCAGLVLQLLGRIPAVGEQIAWGGWQFEVIDMDGLRIDKLLVQPHPGSATRS